MAAICVQAEWHSIRRAAEMMPTSWSSEHPASPEPSCPVTVWTTAARSGPGAMVSASPLKMIMTGVDGSDAERYQAGERFGIRVVQEHLAGVW